MARVFTAEVVLNLLDRMSPGLGKANRSISRELNYMERSFRQVNTAGFGLLAGFTGFAAITSGLSKVTSQIMELSKAQNELAMSATRVEKGMLKVVSASDRARFRAAANQASTESVVSPLIAYQEAALLSRIGVGKEAVPSAMGALTKFMASVPGGVGDTNTFQRSFVATQFDFLRPMGPNDINKTLTEAGEVYSEAANRFNVTVNEINDTMRIAGPMLQSAGYTLREAAGMAGALALRRIVGSEAGVFLRSEMVRMIDPTPKGMAAIQDLMHLVPEQTGLKGAEKKAYDLSIKQEFNKRYNQTRVQGGQAFFDAFQQQFPGFQKPGTQAGIDEFNAAARTPGGSEERHSAILALMSKYGLDVDPNTGEKLGEGGIERAASALMLRTSQHTEFDKFMADFVASGGTSMQLAKMFQGRQTPRGMAYIQGRFEAMKWGREATLVTDAVGEGRWAGKTLQRSQVDEQMRQRMEGPAGALLRMDAAMARLADALTVGPVARAIIASFDALTAMLGFMEKIANATDITAALAAAKDFASEHPVLAAGATLASIMAGGAVLNAGKWGLGRLLVGGGGAAAGGGMGGLLGWGSRLISSGGVIPALMGGAAAMFMDSQTKEQDLRTGLRKFLGFDDPHEPSSLRFYTNQRTKDDLGPYRRLSWLENFRRFNYGHDFPGRTKDDIGWRAFSGGRTKDDDFRVLEKSARNASEAAAIALLEMTDDFDRIAQGFTGLVAIAASAMGGGDAGGWLGAFGGAVGGIRGFGRGGLRRGGGIRWQGEGGGAAGPFSPLGDAGFDYIAAHEGTFGNLSDTLAHGAFGGKGVDLTKMTLNEVFALSEQIRHNPRNRYNAGPMGALQILGSTMMSHAARLGMDPATTLFDKATQIALGQDIKKTEGLGAWASLHGRGVPGGLFGTPSRIPAPIGGKDKAMVASTIRGVVGERRGGGEREESSATEVHQPIQVRTEVNLDKEKVGSILSTHFHRRGRRMPSEIHPR